MSAAAKRRTLTDAMLQGREKTHAAFLRWLENPINKAANVEAAMQFVWTTISSEDHYAHATFYYNLARSTGGAAEFASEPRPGQTDLIEETSVGVYRTKLKEMMDEQHEQD